MLVIVCIILYNSSNNSVHKKLKWEMEWSIKNIPLPCQDVIVDSNTVSFFSG